MSTSLLVESVKTIAILGVLFFIARWFGGVGVGAPLVPLKRRDYLDGIALSALQPDELAVDLGSGDGRILSVAASLGARVIGYEINPIMAWYSRRKLRAYGDKARIFCENLMKADLSRADVIYIFQMGNMMGALKEKIRNEGKKGVRVVTFAFALPNMEPEKEQGIAKLYRF